MGVIVKLLGSGLGLTSEAIHAARSRSPSGHPASSSTPPLVAPAPSNAPPEYVEVTDEAAAEELIRSGRAERVTDQTDDRIRRACKAAEAGDVDDESDDGSSDEVHDVGLDEAAWELDEMVEDVALPTYEEPVAISAADPEEVKVKKEDQMIRDLVRAAGSPPQPPRRIPCPVIIPQRRPRQEDRGFVRAYAPVLADCGVSQEVFLKFLSDWNSASKASPWIDVIFIAASVVGFVPEVAAQVVSTVVQVVAGTAREMQSRHRRNTFLDRVNEDLFMPRGLYAMVMAFKEEVHNEQGGLLSNLSKSMGQAFFAREKLDINQTAAKYSNPDQNLSKIKKGLKDIRLTSGKTYGEIELPEAAELVFPDLDRAAMQASDGDEKEKGPAEGGISEKWKNAGTWVQDYFDRRAHAFYEAEHEGSSLVVPSSQRKPMVSRYNDPNHPANSGSLISLLTGGIINKSSVKDRRARRRERRAAKREYYDSRRVARGRSPRGPRRIRGERQGIIKKILQQDVLYLLVVNLPSQEEVQESVARLEHIMTQEGISESSR